MQVDCFKKGGGGENLSCFTDYDIRGRIGVNIDHGLYYKVGLSLGKILKPKVFVIGRDARETSPGFADSLAQGLIAVGVKVLDLGLCGTEEMYWAVNSFEACGGAQVTASHNAENYNGLKIVKSGARPLDRKTEFLKLKKIMDMCEQPTDRQYGERTEVGSIARKAYVEKLLSFLGESKEYRPIKIVVNSVNGAAGPTFASIAAEIKKRDYPFQFVHINCNPGHRLPKADYTNTEEEISEVIRLERADFGVAFDADFDRCAFFDSYGNFVKGEYIVSLFARYFLKKSLGALIAYDRRSIWCIEDAVFKHGGSLLLTRAGHANFKAALNKSRAIYGGEISNHHYFRDFACCDSGMIPWIVMAEILNDTEASLANLVQYYREKFPSSGEKNFKVKEPEKSILRVLERFGSGAQMIDAADGISLAFGDWRFNLRQSNTEPVLRLNLESRGDNSLVESNMAEISKLLVK